MLPITSSSIASRRGRLAYDVAGQGPCVVLLHPIGVDRTWWESFVAAWCSRRTLIAIDLPGHGESAALTTPITLEEHAQCVWEVLDAQGIGKSSFVGVSMGGMVAQYAAILRPRATTSLVACATAATFPDEARGTIRARGNTALAGSMTEVIPATLNRWFSNSASASLVAKCDATLRKDDWYSWSANWEAISALDSVDGLWGVQIPALAIACCSDASLPVAATRRVAEAARGEFLSVDDASHFGIFETPERFIPLIDAFLARQETPLARRERD